MNRPISLGIVGLGGMGSAHARRVLGGEVPGLALRAVCDVAPDLPERFPNQRCFHSAADLFASGEIEAVLIATPHYAHTSLGIAALEAGLHVLLEKPVSVHKADAEALVAAHRDPKQIFAAMFNMRTRPLYRRLRALLSTGELGPVRRIQWTLTDWFRTEAYYRMGAWRGTWEGEGGGVLLNQCPHQLDLWQWLFGMPQRVYARCQLGRYHRIEVEDDVQALLEYADGTIGHFSTSTGETPGSNRLEIAGEMGKLVVEDGTITWTRNAVAMSGFCATSPRPMGQRPETTVEIITPPPPPVQEHAAILANFAAAIAGNAPLIAPAVEGAASVELANAMLLSTLHDRAVELPLDGALFEKELAELIASSARHRAGNRANRMSEAFTVTELLVTMALLIFMALLATVSFSKAVDSARQAYCLGNLRETGRAAISYAEEHRQRLPMPKDWTTTDADGGVQARWYLRLAPYLYPGVPMPDPTAKTGPVGGVLRCPKGEAYALYGRALVRKGGWSAVDYGALSGNGNDLYLYSPHLDRNVWLVEAETYRGNLIGQGASAIDAAIPPRARQRHGGLHLLFASGRVAFLPKPGTAELVEQLTLRFE